MQVGLPLASSHSSCAKSGNGETNAGGYGERTFRAVMEEEQPLIPIRRGGVLVDDRDGERRAKILRGAFPAAVYRGPSSAR